MSPSHGLGRGRRCVRHSQSRRPTDRPHVSGRHGANSRSSRPDLPTCVKPGWRSGSIVVGAQAKVSRAIARVGQLPCSTITPLGRRSTPKVVHDVGQSVAARRRGCPTVGTTTSRNSPAPPTHRGRRHMSTLSAAPASHTTSGAPESRASTNPFRGVLGSMAHRRCRLEDAQCRDDQAGRSLKQNRLSHRFTPTGADDGQRPARIDNSA